MSEISSKQVKVDNWGIYFLQRLKHFFNRTDYCDLTLQFQDNAQLKVHRLVLSACTEYFEILERTCEMYEDCLVMPDDLQADVVVPIINFMYTGQLEFKLDLLERLYQTSLVMNMPVLTKLLDAHRTHVRQPPAKPAFQNSSSYYGKRYLKSPRTTPTPGSSNKRSFTSAFNEISEPVKMKKPNLAEGISKAEYIIKNGKTPSYQFPVFCERNKRLAKDPRPTRYELPEELDEDNIFDNSFSNISYTTKPLMVHPESTKKYSSKKSINLFEESTSSNRYGRTTSANDIVECRKISMADNVFLDDMGDNMQDECSFQQSPPMKDESKDTSQLFDQMLDNTSKITIEAKNTQTNNIDYTKIISEVLKKHPNLVKSNKNIKLKILNTSKPKKSQVAAATSSMGNVDGKVKPKVEVPDFTYESDVINSKEAARLIAMGAENVLGPWICLICGTPGKALHFTTYYNFRKHLVEIHNEKPVPTLCEYCGVRSMKRNYLVYHKLTKHGVPAPSHYNFPKCNYCSYIALNEALMVKHKTSHSDRYKFPMQTIIPSPQVTGMQKCQKYPSPAGSDKQKSQCVYCMRIFLRERNLYAHLKTNHKEVAKNDGLIDDSEEEQEEEEKYASKLKSSNDDNTNFIKLEVPVSYEQTYEDANDQYQIEQKPDGSIYVVSKKAQPATSINKNKILNLGFNAPPPNTPILVQSEKTDNDHNTLSKKNEFSQNMYVPPARQVANEEIVIIDNNEYILRDNHLIPRKEKQYIPLANPAGNTEVTIQTIMPTTSMEYHSVINTNSEHKVLVKKSHVNQPLQIVVSNEEEYKALMNSNQSVIYDEGETNKTLAVLTAENQSMETGAIDLDNNQSNDMMIIQDDFPMNVSETVSTDNSNIVVVYSHPLEDQSKQYSLIATQGIDGGYVQSSAILTQNYETVTTCTPVMSAHTTLENSWQNNIHANINKLNMTQTSDLQAMTVGESITIEPIETNTLNELPEVHIANTETVPMQVTHIKPNENNFNQPSIIAEIHQQSSDVAINQQNALIAVTNSGQQSAIIAVPESSVLNNMEQQTIADIPPLAVPGLAQADVVSTYDHASAEENVEQTVIETVDPATSNSEEISPHILGTEILQHDDPNMSTVPVIASDTCVVPINENTIIQSNVAHQLPDNNFVCEPIVQNNTVEEDHLQQERIQESIVEKVEDMTTVDPEDSQATINNTETSLIDQGTVDNIDQQPTKVAQEQIENLTSEWSEDETDNQVQQDNISKSTPKEKIQITNIEIIHKEVEQQVSSEMEQDTEDSTASSQDDNMSNHKSQINKTTNIDPVSQEKISSLLNDWDDNESQEEETPVVAEVSGDTAQTEEVVAIDQNVPENNSELNKNDNIKSLVSDWDEEDETKE